MPDASTHLLAALAEPGFYPHPAGKVVHLETHISHVFLAGDYAYKLKKPVNFGFLDFSSLAARIAFCREELTLNRRLAPALYLAVWAVAAAPEAPHGLALRPLDETDPARVVEPCLRMARMDGDRMMDGLLARGEVDERQIAALARLLADFYARAGRGPEVAFYGQPEQVRVNVEENFRQTADYQEVSVAPGRWRAIRDYSLGFLARNWRLLKRRAAAGLIVDGHGDLHSGNINLPKGAPPLIFDCIEFNQRFRYQDLACDLAFLAMDLDFHGREDLSRRLMAEFVAAGGDPAIGEVLDFYKCYRAVVRAKIHGFTFDDQHTPAARKFTDLDKARAYFRLAARYAGGEPPYFLVALMGLMGAGKSFLAERLGRALGWPVLASDPTRKRLFGVAPRERREDSWGQGLYGPAQTEATYRELLRGARARLAQGGSVVLDASFAADRWRREALALARETGARPLFVELVAAPEVLAARLNRRAARGQAVSDGRRELLAAQLAAWEDAAWLDGEGARLVLDAALPWEAKLAALTAWLARQGHQPAVSAEGLVGGE